MSVELKLPDRYQPTGESSAGGYGDVRFCVDQHLDRLVAIKTITDVAEEARLDDEIRALMLLRSKHVVQVFDLVKTEGALGIVLEFIDGDDLLSSEIPYQSLESCLKVLWQVASGISDIHSKGVVHRDIKPNNMKLDAEGVVKIFDFGLSRPFDDARTIGFKGTRGFAAPELILGGAVNFTSAVDVYAFGVMALLFSHRGLPAELTTLPPSVAPQNVFQGSILDGRDDLTSMFVSCLDHNPDARPKASELRNSISRHLLFEKHQALAVMDGVAYYLNSSTRTARLKRGGIGEVMIKYDGLRFFFCEVSGEVYVNNKPAMMGAEIPSSCVVAIGAAHRGNHRTYITFDVSNPEVTV